MSGGVPYILGTYMWEGLFWRLFFFVSATTSPKQVHMCVGERAKRGHSWPRRRARGHFSGVRVTLFTRALAKLESFSVGSRFSTGRAFIS